MTIDIQVLTLTSSIAALTVTGVKIYDVDEIPATGSKVELPAFFPQPADFITGFTAERITFGSNGTAKIDVNYVLHYVYLHSKATIGLKSLPENNKPMLQILLEILKVILANDAMDGAVDVQIDGVPNISQISDPDGNQWWGALVDLRVLEYAQ